MGSLLITTGVLIYGWISCAHYSFLNDGDTPSKKTTKSSNIFFQSLAWPLLQFHPNLKGDTEELEV